MLPNLFFISILCSSFILTRSYSQCLDHQKTLLLQLKNELLFNSSLSTKLVQWNQTDQCCNWYGVDCDDAGFVISLHLDYKSISGGIGDSSTLFKLEHLEKLNLAYNKMSNTHIHSLTSLTHLNLSNVVFRCQVPVEILFLKRLVSLDISPTRTTKSSLVYFDLEYNSFSGSIPTSLFRLLSLLILDLSNKRFTGVGEFGIANVSNLVSLDLRSNQLAGPIPNSFFQLQSLESLLLSENLFTGTYQLDKIQTLASLKHLDLSSNDLSVYTGNDSSISPVRTFQLKELRLVSSNLYDFPYFVNSCDHMVVLDLSNNRIPSWIWRRQLKLLNLSLNLLTSVQKPYQIPTSLQLLDLNSNNLGGHLPTIGNLKSDLRYFLLANNTFNGLIPTSLCSATKLTSLDLSENKLSGSIPSCLLDQNKFLTVLHLGRNNINGHVPDSFSVHCSIQYLDLNNTLEEKSQSPSKIASSWSS